MKHAVAAILCAWLLVHPWAMDPITAESDPLAFPRLRRWWNRNVWVATSTYDTKAECERQRTIEFEQANSELERMRARIDAAKNRKDYLRTWKSVQAEWDYATAWSRVLCIPSDAAAGYKVQYDLVR